MKRTGSIALYLELELDIAASRGKLRSAPGADGFTNYLIKKCWHLLRIPFFKYVTHCYNTSILTQNFRSATIKLIPKKGDLSALKNWRPISLLSNFYKILSHAINTRLNRFVNRICSRALERLQSQTVYTRSPYKCLGANTTLQGK
jgi:hypothetical protein